LIARSTDDKIHSLAELAGIVDAERQHGRRVVLCHGVFDLLHPGHIKHFEAAKRFGDVLVVTVTKDEYVNKGPGRPVFNHRLRAETIAALQTVDYVAINEWATAVETIRRLRPHVYVKGNDYADPNADLTQMMGDEAAAVASVGGVVEFTDEISFSSTHLLNSHFAVFPEEVESVLREFRQRYSSELVIERLRALRRLKVLVVGEAIIDEYDYCIPLAKSPKDTFIVAKHSQMESFAGGALAVANHVAAFCNSVDLVTTLGRDSDEWEPFIRDHLKPSIKPALFRDDSRKTIIKRRFVEPSFMKKLFEISFIDDGEIAKPVESQIVNHLAECLGSYDVVILSDFGHGLITGPIGTTLTNLSPYLAMNVQTNSQNQGFNLVTKHSRTDYLCVDEPELRLAAGDRATPVADLIPPIAKRLNCSQASVTRGSKGTITYSPESGHFDMPALSDKVVDTVGAGDAYLAVTALCAVDGFPIDLLAFVGNVVGSQAVQIVGNRKAIDPISVFKSVNAILH
jgi:rfaE bifunctional protein nucleotidyltransferase chain/domain